MHTDPCKEDVKERRKAECILTCVQKMGNGRKNCVDTDLCEEAGKEEESGMRTDLSDGDGDKKQAECILTCAMKMKNNGKYYKHTYL